MMRSLEVFGKRNRWNRSRRSEALWGYISVAPLCIGLLLFLSVPLVYSLYLSLTEYSLFAPPQFVGFDNFVRAFTNEDQFWRAMVNAAIACLGVPISMVASMLLANLLSKKLAGTKFFRMVFFLPTVCSVVAITIMWQTILDYHFGALNNFLRALNLDRVNWMDEKHALPSLIFMGVWSGLGINILLYLSAVKNVPRAYFEAAQLDGANAAQMFLRITLPAISPVSFYILITGIIGTLQDFAKYQVFGNGQIQSAWMPVLIIYNYSGNNYGSYFGYASCLAILLGLVIACVTCINFFVSKKWVYYES